VLLPAIASADEGGTSFWTPGTFASFSAVPQQPPGWALSIIDYYVSANAGADVATARAITAGRIPTTVRLDETSTYMSRHDNLNINPSYAFATPVFGGQFSLGVTVAVGTETVELDRALTVMSGASAVTGRINERDTTTGFGDVDPLAQLRWGSGVNNWTTYVTANIPVGTYDSRDLSNIGIGHGAVDAGGGYTYYDSKKGSELSVVTGFTYNLINPHTDYQNGVDWHLDWALSQSVSKDIYVGAVGYLRSDRPRQRRRRSCRAVRVASHGGRSAGQLHVLCRLAADQCQSQELLGIRRRTPSFGLECVAHGVVFADRA
jgi:hypothetical protein